MIPTDYSCHIKVVEVNHMGFISCHIIPLVIYILGVDRQTQSHTRTHARTHARTHTHTHTHTHRKYANTDVLLRNQIHFSLLVAYAWFKSGLAPQPSNT